MNKTLLTCLTMFICIAPTSIYWFNIPFTFSESPSYAPTAAHSCALHQLDIQASLPFGADFGKFIKESQIATNGYQIKTVILDAGHGGKDPGCSGKKSREKDIALGVVLKLGQKLQRNYPGLNVIYTRNRDVFIPLHRRASIANDNHADLFISIHCNYIRGSTATRGSETYVMGLHTAKENLAVAKRENEAILYEKDYKATYGIDPNSNEGHILHSLVQNVYLDQSVSFAAKVENQIAIHEQRKSRGVKQAGFLVLRETAMPSVLVETGFLSSNRDETYLLSHGGQDKVAESVFRAFQEYKHEVEDYNTPVYEDSPKKYAINTKNTSDYTPTKKERELEDAYKSNAPVSSRPTLEQEQIKVPVQAPMVKSVDRNEVQKERITKTRIDWDEIQTSQPAITAAQDLTDYAFRTPKPQANNDDMRAKAPIEYRVQLTASPNRLDLSSGRWLDLNKTDYWAEPVWEEGQHKYQVMNITSFSEAEQIRLKMRELGFFDAFVIAYQGLKQLSVNEAVKLQGR